MTSNFKMRSVSFKRKNSETLSQRKPEKLARTNSNVKILSVQTLNPPQDLNKVEAFDKFIAPTVPDKKHRDEIINEDKENNSNLQNQFNENKVIEAGDIKGCSQGSVKELPTSVQPQFEANNQSGAKKIAGFGNEVRLKIVFLKFATFFYNNSMFVFYWHRLMANIELR